MLVAVKSLKLPYFFLTEKFAMQWIHQNLWDVNYIIQGRSMCLIKGIPWGFAVISVNSNFWQCFLPLFCTVETFFASEKNDGWYISLLWSHNVDSIICTSNHVSLQGRWRNIAVIIQLFAGHCALLCIVCYHAVSAGRTERWNVTSSGVSGRRQQTARVFQVL